VNKTARSSAATAGKYFTTGELFHGFLLGSTVRRTQDVLDGFGLLWALEVARLLGNPRTAARTVGAVAAVLRGEEVGATLDGSATVERALAAAWIGVGREAKDDVARSFEHADGRDAKVAVDACFLVLGDERETLLDGSPEAATGTLPCREAARVGHRATGKDLLTGEARADDRRETAVCLCVFW
jgi:hypothetical protein